MVSSKRSSARVERGPSSAGRAVIRIGTRRSDLALLQARMVERALNARGLATELVPIRTAGDKRNAEPFAAIGAKGLFTKELELALVRGKVDCCVHSLKDIPTPAVDDVEIAAILEREDPRDVLVLNAVTQAEGLDDLPSGSRVGTSSLRRRALLAELRPDVEAVDLRGNVPTRLKKLDTGAVHAAILAAAGLIRLGATQRIRVFLEPPQWLPAPGQGAIAVQIRAGDTRMRDLLAPLNHAPTAAAVRAERALLSALDGGCQVPIGALVISDSSAPALHAFISDVHGRHMLRGETVFDPDDPERSGTQLAENLRSRGASTLLAELRGAEKVPAPQPE
jgi:hydroxymethylbilane synthase